MKNLGSLYAMIASEIAILITLFLIIKKQKGKSQLKTSMMFLLGCIFIWTLGSIFQILFQNHPIEPIVFEKFSGIGVHYCPVAFLALSVIFAKTKIKIRWYHYLLLIIPTISTILMFTNELHNLMFVAYSPDVSKIVYGSWFNVHTAYTYLVILAALVYFLRYSFKHSGFFSKQSILAILGISAPLVVNALATLKLIPATTYTTPISFALMAIIYAFAIFRFGFMKVTPIALQRIVDRMSDGFIVLNEKSIIIDFNETFLKMFNIDSKVARNRNVFELIENDEKFKLEDEIFKETLEKAYVSNQTFSFDAKFINEDKYFNIEANNIKAKNNLLGILVLFKDITQHMQDQEIMVRQAEFASLGEVAGGIAHDVNSPLRAVAGEIYNFKHYIKSGDVIIKEEKKEKIDKMLTTMDTSVENIAKIIETFKNQMIDTGRKDKGEFSLLRVIDSIKILLGNSLRKNCCTLNVNIEQDINIYGEDNKLGRVINNLVKNAIEAYRDNESRGDININAKVENNNGESTCMITVEDNAGGISDRISNSLFKERVTTKSATDGTGIGLYSSYRLIVVDFKGKISFETKKGEGTKFVIEIPMK